MRKERPILFSTSMVRAILEGRKTQTRRVVKLQPLHDVSKTEMFVSGNTWASRSEINNDGGYHVWRTNCPYGKPGDVLWVRETWQPSESGAYVHFKADWSDEDAGKGWKPSIHMPKDAARIWLEIVNVRVERLQDISEQDAIAEGIHQTWIGDKRSDCAWKNYIDNGRGSLQPEQSFFSLWESINGKESLEANPWVWVVEFKQIQKP